jgi:hypothetical protein
MLLLAQNILDKLNVLLMPDVAGQVSITTTFMSYAPKQQCRFVNTERHCQKAVGIVFLPSFQTASFASLNKAQQTFLTC